MALSVKQVEAVKPAEKLVKLSDSGGLQLWVQPNGSKLWRLAYRFGGKQKVLSLGIFPVTTLAEAREKAYQHKKTLADGIDPSVVKRFSKGNTFDLVADEYLEGLRKEGRSNVTIDKNGWLLRFARPIIGARPIDKISAAEVLAVLNDIDRDGSRRESARRARAIIGAVFRHAIVTQRAENDPTLALRGALKAQPTNHRAALTDATAFGGLLRAIRGYEGEPATRLALELAALTAARPGELRLAEWSEFDLEAKVWTVPAGRMKMRREHISPLSSQSVQCLRQLHKLTSKREGRLLFPSTRSPDRAISDNTLNAALRRLGYTKDDATAHGFRSSFSSLSNESGKWHPDAIERQLAHVDSDAVRKAYARGAYWDERVKLVQWWADECDRLRDGTGKVIDMHKGRA